jgi:hypothetical protein
LRILLVDAGWNQTAFLIAELARAGAQTTVLSPSYIGDLSRYCRHVPSPDVHDPAYPDLLRAVLRTEPADIVLPLCESVQRMIWALPEEEQRRVFPQTTAMQRELLSDRVRLYEFASGLDIPIPRPVAIADQQNLREVLTKLGLPCVLRGTQGMSGEQVRIVNDATVALAAYRELRSASPDPPFAQEYIHGRRYLIGGLFDHGRALQWFSSCSLETSPAPTGPSVRVQSVQDAVLKSYGERLFRALEWDGIACAEFMRLAPGDFRFLEINPRPWATIMAADKCGIPLLRLFANYLHGRRPAAAREFADGIEYTLFPSFLLARLRARKFPQLSDLKAYRQLLLAAPWRNPALLMHFTRMLWWAHNAHRNTPGSDAPLTSGSSG